MTHSIAWAAALALGAAACFGSALVGTRLSLRSMALAPGAVVSISTTTVAFWCLAPVWAPPWPWSLRACLVFAAVGVFFPAIVTLLTFAANARMGPSAAGALGSTTPFFAVLGSVVLLGESPAPRAWVGLAAIVLGVAALSWRGGARADWHRAAIALPLIAAVLRGLAQAAIKGGLSLQPSPFLAGWIGYTVSAAVVWGAWRLRAHSFPGPWRRAGVLGFMGVGVANGAAVLLTYEALHLGTVALVAPVVATTPLFALGLSAVLLRGEPIRWPQALGVLLTVAGVVLILLRGHG